MAPGAFHNSAERYDPPKCHPKTREAVLKKIMDWVQGLGELERRCYFMWLYGPAGAGKSAIAQTIAELCDELKLLAASFFFSRTAPGRNDHSRLIATLTYQLCLSIPEIGIHVEEAMELDPNIFSLSLENQVRKLIIEPLSHLHNNVNRYHASRIHTRLFIIDGLDECTSALDVQCHVLQVLAKKLPMPMLFLVASRPEPHIRGFFTEEPMTSITTTLALDNSYHPDADIEVFIKAKFDAIKRYHPLSHHLPEPWPSTSDVDRLVCKASGQFIYASTVMKYIESPRHWPTDRLKTTLGIMTHGKDTPFADLDALYTQIFSSVEDINKVLEVFAVLLLVNFVNFPKSSALIEALLGLRYGDLNITLIDLHSILDIPPEARKREIRILHASLGDFLLDQRRAGSYYIDPGYAHANLARHFMRCITQNVTDNGVSSLFFFEHRQILKIIMLSRSETSLLNICSSDSFTKHCIMSYPTAELLDVLWSFDTFYFWTLFYGRRTFRGSEFVTWLKNNVSHALVIYSSGTGNADLVHCLGVYQGRTRLVFSLYARLGPVHSGFSNKLRSQVARWSTYYALYTAVIS